VRKSASAFLVAVALLVAGCGYGDDDDGNDAENGSTPTSWSGPPKPDENGMLAVDEYNEYAESLPAEDRQPREMVLEFLQPRDPYEITVNMRPGGATAVVLRDDLEDDSVRAERTQVELGLGSGGVWRLNSAQVMYQCHEGRGHAGFSPELCF
jgi:hypothetical protein